MPRLVLIADGSPSHQRRAQGILTGEGLEVLTVSNGVAAIKKLPTIKPALILADVSMPGRDGYEVCDFVKNSPNLTRVPVLLSYSDQAPYDESRAQRVRADGRIKKPFGQDELLGAVNRFLVQEEAAPPPPPVRAPIPAPIEPMEPVDLPPEETQKIEMPDLGALSESPAFGEQAITDEAPELSPPAISIEEAFSRHAEAEAARGSPAVDFAAMAEKAAAEEPQPAPEPMLVEESGAAAAEEEEEEPAARTMMFRMPVQIAEPILADDMAPPAPVQEAPPPPAPEPLASETEIAASTLESYSLTDAAAGQVSIAPPTPEEAPSPAVEESADVSPPAAGVETEAAPPPAQEAAAGAAVLDTELVHWIVHNVVVRMAPPALSTSHVEELIRQITDEMINDLTQPPPEA